MASPYGHALVGLSLFNLCYPRPVTSRINTWLLYGLVVLGALAPDLDFIPGLFLGNPGRFHHGFFHSLGTAVGLSLMAGFLIAFLGWTRSFLKTSGFIFILVFSHLFLDFFTEAPSGFPMFWPVSETYFLSSVPIFPRVLRTWGHPDFWTQALFCFSVESVLLIPLWIISWRRVIFPK